MKDTNFLYQLLFLSAENQTGDISRIMQTNTLKVLTYNIHKGFNSTNRQFILHDIKESIRQVDADLIFLQEIHGERNISKNRFDDWPSNNQFEFLADEVWHHHAYAKNAIYKSGHHGNAILSKYPIVEWENIDGQDRILLYSAKTK